MKNLELAPFNTNYDFFKPNYSQSICKVIPSAVAILGGDVPEENMFSKHINEIGQKRIVINFLVDSLGLEQLDRNDPFVNPFCSLLDGTKAFPISSVFPTITSTCLTSYHTGLLPSEHGIVGHRIYFREIGSLVDTLVQGTPVRGQRNILPNIGVRVKKWILSNNPIYHYLPNDTIKIDTIHKGFEGTGLAYFFKGDASSEHYLGVFDLIEQCEIVVNVAKSKKNQCLFFNLYLGQLDAISHSFGPQSEPFRRFLLHFMETLKWLFNRLKQEKLLSECAITLTADHGQVAVDPKKIVNLSKASKSKIWKAVKMIGKSGRLLHFYGAKLENSEEIIGKALEADRGLIAPWDQLKSLLGLVIDENESILKSRFGEWGFLFGQEGEARISAKPNETMIKLGLALRGSHGSLSRNELTVPCIISSGEDFEEVLTAITP